MKELDIDDLMTTLMCKLEVESHPTDPDRIRAILHLKGSGLADLTKDESLTVVAGAILAAAKSAGVKVPKVMDLKEFRERAQEN